MATSLPRSSWLRALTAHEPEALKALARDVAAGWHIRLERLPQAGLALLALKEGAFDEAWYLGEFPISVCELELETPTGQCARGAAQVMADDAELARALAILDACLAGGLPGAERIAGWLESGVRKRAEEDARRQAMLAATRVDFCMLNDVAEEDDERP